MNRKQLSFMWCGITAILFIAFVTVLVSYKPTYGLFVFWTFLVIMVTAGFIKTFDSKQPPNKVDQNRRKEMNLRMGFKRLVIVLSLIPAFIGITMFIVGLTDGDDDLVLGGLLTALIGYAAIWAIYGIVLYIIKGFTSRHCENCEKSIGKLEEQFKFKEHMVCTECHKKLSGNQKDDIS